MYGEGKKYPRVCVSAAIMDKKGRVLATRRSSKVWYPGTWCLPGGHVDGGEDWLSAVRKEAREEVGLVTEQEVLQGIYSNPATNILPDPITNEKRCFVSATFLIKQFSGEVTLTDEISEFGWFYANEMPREMLPSEATKFQDAFTFNGTVYVR